MSEVIVDSFSAIIQVGIDAGIPFDEIPTNALELGYLQACLQWVIFVLTVSVGFFNNLMRSSMGAIR